MGVLSFVVFVLIFAGMVLIHEFGHFSAARLLKIHVEEFGIGLPPRILRFWREKGWLVINGKKIIIPTNFTLPFEAQTGVNRDVTVTVDDVDGQLLLRTIDLVKLETPAPTPIVDQVPQIDLDLPSFNGGKKPQALASRLTPGSINIKGRITALEVGTEYTINLLPLGGFVRPKGENDPNIAGGLAATAPWKRFVVLSAGPAMNLILGVLVYSLLFAQMGIPNTKIVTIQDVSVDSPAEQAGLKANDIVLSFNNIAIDNIDQLRTLIRARLDQPSQIIVKRGTEQLTFSVTPSSTRPVEKGATGVLLSNLMEPASPITAISYGMRATGGHIYSLVTLPAQIISGAVSSDQARLVGLKGIFDMTDQAVQRDIQTRETPATGSSTPQTTPTNYTLTIIAALTISLGVFNLFPIPALDGGRIIFILPELLLRRRVPYQVENTIHFVSYVLLLLLMIYINVMDFVNPANIILP